MQVLENMINKLSTLGIYNLDEESLVYAELSAYAEGLNIINEYIEQLGKECIISTSESYGLSKRESLFSYCKVDLTPERRRAILIGKNSIRQSGFTKSDIEKALASAGLDANITENFASRSINISCYNIIDNSITQSKIISLAKNILPPHLQQVFNFS